MSTGMKIALALFLALMLLVVCSSATGASPPPGNNGTIKVHEANTESPEDQNDPKVCTFHLHGFGFDPGQQGVWRIDRQLPEVIVTVKSETYKADANGQFKTDIYTLPNGKYKVYWQGRGSPPLEEKHKVFKVGCPATPTATRTNTPVPTATKANTKPPPPTRPPSATPSRSPFPPPPTLTASPTPSPSQTPITPVATVIQTVVNTVVVEKTVIVTLVTPEPPPPPQPPPQVIVIKPSAPTKEPPTGAAPWWWDLAQNDAIKWLLVAAIGLAVVSSVKRKERSI